MQYTLLPVLLFFLITQTGLSQIKSHYIQPGFHCFSPQLMPLTDDTMMVVGMTGHSDGNTFSQVFISYLSGNGDLLETRGFRHEEFGEEVNDEHHFHQLTNGMIAVLPAIHSCDYYSSIFLGCIDPRNDYVWATETYLRHGNSYTLSQVASDLIRFSDTTRVWYTNLLGNIVDPGIELHHLSNRIPYLSGYLASLDEFLLVLDSDLQISRTTKLRGMIRDIQYHPDHGYAVMTSDSLYLLRQDLDIQYTINIANLGIHSVTMTDSSVWLASQNVVRRLHPQLQFVEEWSVPETIALSDILAMGDTLFLTGLHRTIYNDAAVCLAMHADSVSFDFYQDASIIDIRTPDSPTYMHTSQGYDGEDLFYIRYGRVFCTIQNNGTVPLHSIVVRTKRQVSSICGTSERQFMWRLSGLNIMPGEIQEVYLDSLRICCVRDPFAPLCLWTAGPNDQPDAFPVNDRFCHNPDIISDVRTHSEVQEIRVIPNPTSHFFSIEMTNPLATPRTLRIIDHLGRMVHEEEYFPGNRVNTQHLSPGLYHVVIGDRSMQMIAKLVVSR